MSEDAGEVLANAEEVIQEGTCRCGRDFMVVKVKGQDVPRILHKKPPCEAYKSMRPTAYLAWVNSKTDATPPKPNRAQRRGQAVAQRKQQEVHAGRNRRAGRVFRRGRNR